MSTTMSPRMMRLVRNITEVAVFLAGIAVGLSGAVLGAAAATYLELGPYSTWTSGAEIHFFVWFVPLGLVGLIGGGMLGYGAAMQLWPPNDERAY
jgi:hypothetical protein